jgi:alpha-1,3-rhamnosyl/mannosyltransferase
VEEAIRALHLEEAVQVLGWISREDLYALFERATAFVYPSTFEGFGMPVLEALAAGLPTACSDIAPLHEIAGEAALFFPPADEDAMLDAVQRLLEGALPPEDGRMHARRYSWEAAARATLDVLTEAAQ